MAQARKKYSPRFGEFKVVEGNGSMVQSSLNELKVNGFVDVQSVVSTGNGNILVLIYYKSNVIEGTVGEPAEEVTK